MGQASDGIARWRSRRDGDCDGAVAGPASVNAFSQATEGRRESSSERTHSRWRSDIANSTATDNGQGGGANASAVASAALAETAMVPHSTGGDGGSANATANATLLTAARERKRKR